MKGSPNEPRCGFSNRAAQVVSQFASEVETNSRAWTCSLTAEPYPPSVPDHFPTMPQVFIHGESIGGSDIAMEMYQDGSLREMFDEGRTA